MKNWFLLFASMLAVAGSALADTVTLNGGTVYQGLVVQKDENELLLLRDYGTQWIQASLIKSITYDEASRPTTVVEKGATRSNLFPPWGQIVARASKTGWGDRLRQIPATVVDKGVLKNVPYVSFRCGKEYELNVYGDLDSPACVELGTYGSLLGKESAQNNVIEFVASLVRTEPQQAFVRKLDRNVAKEVHDGVTMEVTPATAEDSYGGWWVSIYSERDLDQARASDAELAAITVSNNSTINTNAVAPWLASLRYAPPVAASPSQSVSVSSGNSSSAAASSDYGLGAYVHNSSRHGGLVWVNGYTRRDGTYVQAYTRSAPRRR